MLIASNHAFCSLCFCPTALRVPCKREEMQASYSSAADEIPVMAIAGG